MTNRKRSIGLYEYLVETPERFYPFRAEIAGKWVRGRRAYEHAVARYERKYGRGHLGFGINCYRSLCHAAASIAIIVLGTLIAKDYFGSEAALYALLALVVLGMAFQEFYLHPRRYRQLRAKGFLDWLSWSVPIGLYLYFFL